MQLRRLSSTEYYEVLPKLHEGFCPDPNISIAIVAEMCDQIVGRIFLLSPVHIEGPWIRETERSKTLGHGLSIALIKEAENEAKKLGITKLFAYGTEETEAALQRLGFNLSRMSVWEKWI